MNTPTQSFELVNRELDGILEHLLRIEKAGKPAKKAADNLGAGLGGQPRKPGQSGLKPGQVPPWVDPWVGVGAAPWVGAAPGSDDNG